MEAEESAVRTGHGGATGFTHREQDLSIGQHAEHVSAVARVARTGARMGAGAMAGMRGERRSKSSIKLPISTFPGCNLLHLSARTPDKACTDSCSKSDG